ncbi:MAG TPA: hypothetical protein DDW76_09875 [Cyanobacteria bacterium UBA11369]|nr:hypothetical protein [Cyanobacteria bacterium UBA11371]HBE30952.1 hypothetical protein [Cyanobacteria bacterium UBA11368]HBE49081.1 hypothetical protein [Cyanobacteria bacterium UBA11369]
MPILQEKTISCGWEIGTASSIGARSELIFAGSMMKKLTAFAPIAAIAILRRKRYAIASFCFGTW